MHLLFRDSFSVTTLPTHGTTCPSAILKASSASLESLSFSEYYDRSLVATGQARTFRILTSTRVAERGRPQACFEEALRKQEDVQSKADRDKDIATLSQLSV